MTQNKEQFQDEQQQIRAFNPKEHVIQIKSGQVSRDYLPVQWRLVWFRTACPHGTIETEMLALDLDRDTEEEVFVWNAEKRRSEKVIKHANGFACFRATVKDGEGGTGMGTKSEKAAAFPDFIEKAETGAIGRALAALGFGTQFAPDLDEGQRRIVDSPVENQHAGNQQTRANGNAQAGAAVNRQQGTNNRNAQATNRTPDEDSQMPADKPIRTRPIPSQAQLKAEVTEMNIISSKGTPVTWPMVVATALEFVNGGAAASMMGKRPLTIDECEKIDDQVEKERELRRRQAAKEAASVV